MYKSQLLIPSPYNVYKSIIRVVAITYLRIQGTVSSLKYKEGQIGTI